ncbi:hypothetical protein RS030_152265 [Cryptosporidium xiaoi]|uniref:TORTIFOLIA1/SINE1-2 N-terminal domain-containing protein n=1 Tax=Cryptosporidium xiaoi TaxID=659607 RepID=A0AAV9Y150_9CRYT
MVMKMEPSDIPGVLSSGLLDSDKMRPMARRFSIKIVEYIVEQFGSELTLPYLNNIINFLIKGCKDSEIHVQNSAVSTTGQISRYFLVEETYQINPDVMNIFMDPLIQFSKKESNPSIQISGIAAISSAIDGISMNIIIMNLNKLMNSLIPIMMNPSTAESCRAVVIDALRKVVVLVWTFLQETPFGSSPRMYDIGTKSLEVSEFDSDGTINGSLTPPTTWKYICGIFGGILRELHPNHTTNSKNVNVRCASLSLLTEVMVCCFVAQAGALLAAHNSNIPLQKPVDGIKSYAELIIGAINLGSKDKSPKVREVAQYCMKRLQEANEAYIPDSQDMINFSYNSTLTISNKEQRNNMNISKANRQRTLNKNFFKNATDETIVRHVSPPSNWRSNNDQENNVCDFFKDNDLDEQCSQEKSDQIGEKKNTNDCERRVHDGGSYGDSILTTTKNSEEDLIGEKESNMGTVMEEQLLNSNSSNKSSGVGCDHHINDHSTQCFCSGSNPFLLNDPTCTVGNTRCNTSHPSPLYIVAQQPVIQGQMITTYTGLPQAQNIQQQNEQIEKQAILEKKIEELTLEVKRLNSKQKELESVAHVLKMVAIHRVDSLEEKIGKLTTSLNTTVSKDVSQKLIDATEEVSNVNSKDQELTLSDFRRQIYNKAKEIVSENTY